MTETVTHHERTAIAGGPDHQSYDRIFRLSHTLATILSPDLTCAYASPNYTRLTGLAPQRLSLAQWRRRIHPDDRRALGAKLVRPLTTVEFRFKHADNRWHWYHADIQPLPDGDEGQCLMMMQDITHYKRAQEQNNHVRRCRSIMQQSRSALLTHMNHELRTPLNAILGFSELLLSGIPLPNGQEYLLHIHESGRTLMQSIDQLLQLARESLYDSLLVEAPHDLRDLLREVSGHTLADCPDAEPRLCVHAPAGAVWCFVDGRKFSLGLTLLLRYLVEESYPDELLDLHCERTESGGLNILLSLPQRTPLASLTPLLRGDAEALLVSQRSQNAPLYLTLAAQLLTLHDTALSISDDGWLVAALPSSRVLPGRQYPATPLAANATEREQEMEDAAI